MRKFFNFNHFLSWMITLVKREAFYLDSSIPTSYLVMIFWDKLIDYFRGLYFFRRPSAMIFIGHNLKIKCISKIKIGYFAKISSDVYIDGLAKNGIVIGDNFSLWRGASIECTGSLKNIGVGLVIGNNVGVGSFTFLGCAGGISIGDDTILGNYVSLHSENHIFSELNVPFRLQGVSRTGITIGKNCWIGAKVTILDGAIIQDNCVIAAGALVSSGTYESFYVYGGIPAKKLKAINKQST